MKPSVASPDLEWLHPEHFGNEPIYCEAPQNPDDVLCPGSDDEAYGSPTERRMRYEAQARRFLEGKPVFLLSASLRGPFDRKSGWVNPWRSKSTSRTKSAHRRRPPASKRATADQNASNGAFSSSVCAQPSPESNTVPPREAKAAPRYMDDESFRRVWDWRDKVLAEAQDQPSPLQEPSQTGHALDDSRLATQYSAPPPATFDGGSGGSLTPLAPSAVNRAGKAVAPRNSGPEIGELPPSSHGKAGHVACSNPAPAAVMENFSFLDGVDLSPPPVRPYEHLVPSRRPGKPKTEDILLRDASIDGPVAASLEKEIAETTKTGTPSAILVEATTCSSRVKSQYSSRTDGSFRYRRKDGRDVLRLPRAGSKLSASLYPTKDADQAPISNDQPANSLLEDKETPEASQEKKTPEAALPSALEGVQEVIIVATGVEEQPAHGNLPQSKPVQSMEDPDEQVLKCEENEEDDKADTPSQIDGPTLVSSGSSSGFEQLSMPSFGHFSAEKHSQDPISETAGFPRRLLWPKFRRSSNRESASPFGGRLEPAHMPQQPEAVGLGLDQDTQENRDSPKEAVLKTANETDVVEIDAEERCPISVQPDQLAIVSEGIDGHAVPLTKETEASEAKGEEDGEPMQAEEDQHTGIEKAGESETGSKRDDEEMRRQDGLPAVVGIEVDSGGEAKPETQLASPVPEPGIQSPWIKEEPAALPSEAADHNGPTNSENIGVSEPQATQSPWVKEADTALHDSGATEHLPFPGLSNRDLALVASQALEQAASQSPWARGDSQIGLPAARLFNPLSSPAYSAVLPTVPDDATLPERSAQDQEDIDMGNSQPYPPHPSTPETKQSGLPTPDFTFPIRPFRDFMTPSPQRPAKRRRTSEINADSCFPSTQALVNATTSNPWARASTSKPGRQKRVSWAPLPDKEEPPTTGDPDTSIDSLYGAELASSAGSSSIPPRRTSTSSSYTHRTRTGSPPPSILATSSTSLPTDANQKFAKHFAAVAAAANRRRGVVGGVGGVGTPLRSQKRRQLQPQQLLLPSASQQICPSPAFDAMADAFLRADAHAHRAGQDPARVVRLEGSSSSSPSASASASPLPARSGNKIEEGLGAAEPRVCMATVGVVDYGDGGGDYGNDDKENQWTAPGVYQPLPEEAEDEHGEQHQPVEVDDVSAVMENLDDYLGGGVWDLDAELAKASSSSAADRRGEGAARGLCVWDEIV